MIYLYSKIKLNKAMFGGESSAQGYYRYAYNDDKLLLQLVYFAVLEELCIQNPSSFDKLAAYLEITRLKDSICDKISDAINNANIIHIDGIITFRLGGFKNDFAAFFDMMRFSYIIKKELIKYV